MVSQPDRQSGHALFVTLIVLVLVGMAGAVLTLAVGLQLRIARDETQRIQLVALSDAALAEAFASLEWSPGFSGADEHEFGPGTIASQVWPPDPLDPLVPPNTRWVTATASLPNGRALHVQARVLLLPTGPVVISWERLPASSP